MACGCLPAGNICESEALNQVINVLICTRLKTVFYIFSLGTKSFSELRFEPVNINRKDIVRIYSHYHRGFLVQSLFLLLLCYKSQSPFIFSLMILFLSKMLIWYFSVKRP